MVNSAVLGRITRYAILALVVGSFSVVLPASAQEESEEYSVGVELVAEGLTAPVALATPNDGSGRLFIVDQQASSGSSPPTAN